MWFAYFCLILMVLVRNAITDDPSPNSFSEPGGHNVNNDYSTNPLIFTGDSMLIAWTTTYDAYDLELWQHINTYASAMISTIAGTASRGVGNQQKHWVVDVDDDTLAGSPVFNFWINTHNESEPVFTSHFFNITNGSSTSTSSATTSTSSATSPTIPPSTSFGSIASFPTETTSLSGTTSKTSDGALEPTTATIHTLTSSAPTGTTNRTDASSADSKELSFRLGMGLGLGVPILLIAGAAIGVAVDRRRKSSRASTKTSTESDTPLTQMPEEKSRPNPESPIISPFIVSPEEPVFSPAVSELCGREIHELPANESKAEPGSH
ncbi:hypothetical protein IWX49DRAFT_596758 [Phyllosticta citricarpa]|uniref:Mid2 domain-containing protein n=2 Tax=Phyllosticta TaxID=121621 RepID=A0ABR1MMR6_9PEZI